MIAADGTRAMIGGKPGEIDELVYEASWTRGSDGVWRCGDLMIGLDPDNPQRFFVQAQPGKMAGLHRAPIFYIGSEYLPLVGYDVFPDDGPKRLIALVSHVVAGAGLPEPPYEGLEHFYAAAEPTALEAFEEARAEAEREGREVLERLPGRTAAELLAETPEEVDWIVPGLLGRRWSLKVAGREKLGKGTFVFYLLGRLERGEPTVFGESRPCSALIYTEEPVEAIREKVKAFGLQQARIVYGYELTDLPSWTEKAQALVGVAAVEGHEIIFVDNISRAASVEDEAGVELSRAVEVLADNAAAAGIATVFDHHHKKGKDRLENMSRGGTGFGGAVDVNVEMTRVGNAWVSTKRKLSALGRMRATVWQRTIELDTEANDYRIVEDEPEAADEEARAAAEELGEVFSDRAILHQLAEASDGTVTAAQFAEAISKSTDTARRRLGMLVLNEVATVEKRPGQTTLWTPVASAQGSANGVEDRGGSHGSQTLGRGVDAEV